MRTRISDLVSTNFALEEIDNEQSAVINERQEELALDGETVSNELESLDQTQAALESILIGLHDLKAKGAGLSLESSRFIQIYLQEANNKVGSDKRYAALESQVNDMRRLDAALESVGDYLLGVLKTKISGFLWLISHITEFFDAEREKAMRLKQDLNAAAQAYERAGATTEDFTGAFGDSLFKQNDSGTSNAVIVSNLKQYSTKINSPAKVKSLEIVTRCAEDVINKIRSNWFFSSDKDVEDLEKLKVEMTGAVRAFEETETGVIGHGRYTLTFDDEGIPRVTRNVISNQKNSRTFKPLNQSEFKQVKQELDKICDRGIELSKAYFKHMEKARSIYGYTQVNNYIRIAPHLLSMLAGFVAGPIGAMVAGSLPSRDILQAMVFTTYMDTLRFYMLHDAKQRNKIVTDGIMLIKRSTA